MSFPQVEMNVFEAILARRSVRKYTSRKVDARKISSLLEAAVRAPSAMNEAPWAFLIIQDKHLLHELSDRAKPLFSEQLERSGHDLGMLNHEDFNVFYDANTLIVICAESGRTFALADCWLAAENLLLAASAMGLGSCIIGASLPALNVPEEKLRLGISGKYEAVVPIVVGYPYEETIATARKRPLVLNRL